MTEQDAAQWYIARDGKQTGPMTDLEINAIAAHRYFRATDLVWRTGLSEWQPALSIFPAPVAPSPPQLPPMASQPVREPVSRTPSPAEVAQKNPTTSPVATARPLSVQVPEPIERTAPRAPQPQQPSEQSRLPASPPFREPTGRFPQSAQRIDQPGPQPDAPQQRYEQPAPRFEQASQRMEQSRDSMNREPGSTPLSRETTQPSRKPIGQTAEPASLNKSIAPANAKKSHRAVWAIAALVLVVTGSVWAAANPGLLKSILGGEPAASDAMASSQASVSAPAIASADDTSATADLDERWQKAAHWQVIKREFPDWYGDRLRETAKSARENKTETEITRSLVEQMIALRRQNASLALSASTPKLKALANAFLNNLRQLKEQSTTACFNFISQGEATPGLLDQFSTAPGASSTMQTQVAAIFDAIGDGRKTPVVHEKPQRTDYDALMAQLAKLGWSQTDVATFADPKALARAEPARVCQMVQDWFTAHISIADDAAQERLLGETLRPVVSG